MRNFDVIVIGGGHAGCEAADAAARLGAKTALLTHNQATIGEMSCNPAIGGLAKGHLVREIDALDGLMARAIDRGGIQFRVLNRSKGPAVRGPRAQADRKLYRAAMQELLASRAGLSILEGAAEELIFAADGRCAGIVTGQGERLKAGAVVITTGTLLRGLIHLGEEKTAAGRIGEAPAVGLALSLEQAGFRIGRLKTAAPARLCYRIRFRRPARAASDPGNPQDSEAFPSRTDQRHNWLRGGGGAGPDRRPQRRARRRWRSRIHPRPRQLLYRRADRRPGFTWNGRALSHVHLARRVSAEPARRQRRSAPDAARRATF